MKIVCFLLKLVLKILLLPVAFLLRFLCFIWNLLMQLSLWVLSPVMLFVLGCGIYSVVRDVYKRQTLQWANEFLRLYPSAKLLVASKKDFETARRKKFCARIATGDLLPLLARIIRTPMVMTEMR